MLWSWCQAPSVLSRVRWNQSSASESSLQQCCLMKMMAQEKSLLMRHLKKKSHVLTGRCRSAEVNTPGFSNRWNNDFPNNCRSSYAGTGIFWFKTSCKREGALGKHNPCAAAGCSSADTEVQQCTGQGWASHPQPKDPINHRLLLPCLNFCPVLLPAPAQWTFAQCGKGEGTF